MAKKAGKKTTRKKKSKSPAGLKDQARKVWLAGLGALAVAESEGGKLFGQLVDKGAALEKRGKPVVDKLVKQATDKAQGVSKQAKARAGKVGDEAKAGWTKVEGAVDEKVTAALHKLGIPTRKEIEDLTKRVEALTSKLDGKPARRKTTRKPAKKAAKKTVRKPAKKAAKKTVRKPAKKAAKKAVRKPAKKTAAKATTSAASATQA